MIVFNPEDVIKSSEINANFAGLADGTEINDSAIIPRHIYNPYKFHAYRSASWTTSSGSIVPLETEVYDTNNNFDTSTYRYTAPVNGYYHFDFAVHSSVTAGVGYYCFLVKNNSTGVIYGNRYIAYSTNPSTWNATHGSGTIQLTAGDYVQVNFVGTTNTGTVGAGATYLSGYLVSET